MVIVFKSVLYDFLLPAVDLAALTFSVCMKMCFYGWASEFLSYVFGQLSAVGWRSRIYV